MTKKATNKPAKKCTDKELLFVLEYMENGRDAYHAGTAVGFADSYAKAHCHSWVCQNRSQSTKPHVWDELARRTKAQVEKYEVSLDRINQELNCLAYVDPAGYYNKDGSLKNIHEMDESVRRSISSMNVEAITAKVKGDVVVVGTVTKLKSHGKRQSLVDLAKINGMIIDKTEHSGPNGGPIPLKMVTDAPPMLETIAEWEEQVRVAKKKALEIEHKEAKTA